MTDKDEAPRGFAVLLQQIDEGCLHAEIGEELQKLAGELNAYAIKYNGDAKGSLTITIGLKASANGTVHVGGNVTTKAPKEARVPSVFWLTKGNNLTPHNPRQQKLPLRDVTPAAGAARDLLDDRSARNV